jgi:hypothetical protein
MIPGVMKRRLHCILKPCLETNVLYLLLPKQLDPLLLIVTIPGRRWVACREEARDTSRRRCWASLKTSALRLRRRWCDLGAALS